MGSDLTALVLEDLDTRQIHFMRIYYEPDVNKLKLIQLGVLVSNTNLVRSPLIRYRGVEKTDSKTGKKYSVGLVLRENGRFEVYSDYMLVGEYYNPQLQCVDIATDFSQFYLKFVKNSHLPYSNVN